MRRRQLLTIFWLLICASSSLAAGHVPLWSRWEEKFEANSDASPDPSTGLVVRLLSPSGKRHVISAFWDGDKTWRVRFMPDEVGRWRYRTIAYPNYPGLSEQTGEFICRRIKSRNRFLQHGAVRVASSGTYLEHADRMPFFWLGDTLWNGPLLSAKNDWDVFLNDRVAKKFSAIQFILEAPWRAALADERGDVAFTGRDSIEINPCFFQRMDERIDAINAHGLLAVPVMLWANHKDDPGQFLSEAQAIRLAKYMLARYGAHHVVWILPGDGNYAGEVAERWKRIGRAVFDGTKHAPVVLHPQGMQWPFDEFKNETWMKLIGYQSGHGDDARTLAWIHSGPPAQRWRDVPTRPILNLEPPYENHVAYQSKQPHSAYNVRRAAYWSLLASPTAGLTYGAHGIWSWETEAREPLNHKGTGIAKPWREAMTLPGSAQMKVLVETLGKLHWWQLRPAPEFLTSQPGGNDPAKFISAAVSVRGDEAVIYLPVGGTAILNWNGAGTFRRNRWQAVWINPRTGQQQRAIVTEPGRLQSPNEQDWLLLLKRSKKPKQPD